MDTPIAILHSICLQNNTTPDYTLLSKEGQVHLPVFTYQVQVGTFIEEASGQSKKKAKHGAAKKMIYNILNDSTMVIPNRDEVLLCLKNQQQEESDSTEASANSGPAVAKEPETGTSAVNKEGGDEGPAKSSTVTSSTDRPSASSVAPIGEPNPIGKLQEICMKKHWNPPSYDEVEWIGPPHERIFKFLCRIENMDLGVIGEGKSKKLAKREAAERMLQFLREQNLDKVDEILDRLPNNKKTGLDEEVTGFNLRTEIQKYQANREKNQSDERRLYQYLDRLRNDKDKIAELRKLFPDVHGFIQLNMYNIILDELDRLCGEVKRIINCRLDVAMHPEKSNLDEFQYWSALVSTEPEFENLTILASFGTSDDHERARKKAISLTLLLFVILFRDVLENVNTEGGGGVSKSNDGTASLKSNTTQSISVV